MDKMGSSVEAGTKGTPATPRDGAPVEIVGLVKSAVRWMAVLAKQGHFPDGVQLGKKLWLYSEWDAAILKHFERCFYIPLNPDLDGEFDVETKLINRRGIYKDTYKSSTGYTDYQLRPNFPIAMCVAPELFQVDRALKALSVASAIVGPVGMRTLDPKDQKYRPNYDNGNQSNDPTVAHGFNYHQGPEWVWPLGFYFRACFIMARRRTGLPDCHLIHDIQSRLQPHRDLMEFGLWPGLPELTNLDGATCRDSCVVQAWSGAVILDLLYEMRDDTIACAVKEDAEVAAMRQSLAAVASKTLKPTKLTI
jgi:glycogen debranching enzyme